MQSGKLDRRITLYSLVKTADELGFEKETFIPVCTVWAKMTFAKDVERYANAQVVSEITNRFIIRYSSQVKDVNSSWRVEYDGQTGDIIGSPKKNSREGTIEISVAFRVNNG